MEKEKCEQCKRHEGTDNIYTCNCGVKENKAMEKEIEKAKRELFDKNGYCETNNPHFDIIFEEAFKKGVEFKPQESHTQEKECECLISHQGRCIKCGKAINYI